MFQDFTITTMATGPAHFPGLAWPGLAQLFKCSIKEGEDGATVWSWSVCTNASGGRRRCFQAYFVLSFYELLKPPLKSNWVTSAHCSCAGEWAWWGPAAHTHIVQMHRRMHCSSADSSKLDNKVFLVEQEDQLHLKKNPLRNIHSTFLSFLKGFQESSALPSFSIPATETFRRVLFSLTVPLALHSSLKQLCVHRSNATYTNVPKKEILSHRVTHISASWWTLQVEWTNTETTRDTLQN